METLDIKGKITLKWILKEQGKVDWTGLTEEQYKLQAYVNIVMNLMVL
jgi:hypothetical protein